MKGVLSQHRATETLKAELEDRRSVETEEFAESSILAVSRSRD
ncbi:MAG: hypothetical protein ACREV8_11915 [Gammaproteobacteria bacterium]